VALNDGSFWIYQYDALGQVTSGKKYFSDNTPSPASNLNTVSMTSAIGRARRPVATKVARASGP